MGEQQIKYLVEVQCRPLSQGQEGRIAAELSRSFPVKQCRPHRAGLTVELASAHPLAYGALKDLADLLEQSLARQGSQLKAGVINRVAPGPVGSAANSVLQALERRAGAQPWLTGLLGRFAARVGGPARPVPVMYFHWGLDIDLMLAGKLQGTPHQLELAAELN